MFLLLGECMLGIGRDIGSEMMCAHTLASVLVASR